jgi:hypothetical protein
LNGRQIFRANRARQVYAGYLTGKRRVNGLDRDAHFACFLQLVRMNG